MHDEVGPIGLDQVAHRLTVADIQPMVPIGSERALKILDKGAGKTSGAEEISRSPGLST
jgi:hypothetical protein